jgi:hypothetical protein
VVKKKKKKKKLLKDRERQGFAQRDRDREAVGGSGETGICTGREGKMGGQTGPTTDNADFIDDLDYTTSQPHASTSVSVKVPFFLSLFEFYPRGLEELRAIPWRKPIRYCTSGEWRRGGDGIPNHKKKRSRSVTLAGRHGIVLLSFFCVLHCVLFAGMRILWDLLEQQTSSRNSLLVSPTPTSQPEFITRSTMPCLPRSVTECLFKP